ncbi:MAG: c-type cytochrome [Chloroflexi bacterium]|nr:c-type cytochrome [Chloroflexota bacterium]MCC6895780.1 c-type cytochrome [Anaerolineae bacterium]
MFERMLVGKIENRITVGLIAFVLTMVFLGWAAINEGGRMAAFAEMQEARAIEQGAMLFAANCTTCHGLDGRGLVGKAPALNSPTLFGHDFFPEISSQISDLTGEISLLTDEKNAEGTTDARKTEIDARIDEINTTIADLNTKRSADVQTAVDKGYNPNDGSYSRLTELGWAGTLDSFLLTTLIHGRPVSENYWPDPMPAWSQTAGGPLRQDQLEDIVAYIENWDKGDNWTLDDLYAVNQFPILPEDAGPLRDQLAAIIESGNATIPEPVGTDVEAITAAIAGLTGDAANGDALYHGFAKTGLSNTLACTGCHMQMANGVGPMTDGTYTRASTERLAEPQFAGYTPEQYLIESIVLPSDYVVPGFVDAMQKDFGNILTPQDMADIIAYLQTQNQ